MVVRFELGDACGVRNRLVVAAEFLQVHRRRRNPSARGRGDFQNLFQRRHRLWKFTGVFELRGFGIEFRQGVGMSLPVPGI